MKTHTCNVARHFCESIEESFSAAEIAEIVAENRAHPAFEALADRCDANDLMADAFAKSNIELFDAADGNQISGANTTLWNDAWDMARAADFDAAKIDLVNPWGSDYDNTAEFWEILDAMQDHGFVDWTSGNDVCPSIGKEISPDVFLTIWVDYADPAKQELEVPRLTVTLVDDNTNARMTSDFVNPPQTAAEAIDFARSLANLAA